MDLTTLSTFAATTFALVNPLGILPVFTRFAAKEQASVQRVVALLISLTVLGLLLLFLLSGVPILKFFGVSLDSFRVAGGILLLLIGINLVMGNPTKTVEDLTSKDKLSNWEEAKSLYSRIVVPLAMPLLCGPGVIANVILYANEAEAAHDDQILWGLMLVCVGVSGLTCIIFMCGQWLKRILGDVGLSIATRILGLLVASMGAQFIITGLSDLIIHTIAPQIMK